MKDYTLDSHQLAGLRVRHKRCRDKNQADRIKCVILLASGWSAQRVAEALMMDEQTARRIFDRFKKGGPDALAEQRGGSEAWLSEQEQRQLSASVEQLCFENAAQVVAFVAEHYDVHYSERGMIALLHRLGFSYKLTTPVPCKADTEAQEAFIAEHEKLLEEKAPEDPVLHIDATHPTHNSVAGRCWIKKGQSKALLSNSGRHRLNIHGAVDVETQRSVVRFDETINADSVVALFQEIEKGYAKAQNIHIVCDNARYYHSKIVQAYLETSRVTVHYLPPYSPNLNLIERYWKYFKTTVQRNRFYPTFSEFKAACRAFFDNHAAHAEDLARLLNPKFQVI